MPRAKSLKQLEAQRATELLKLSDLKTIADRALLEQDFHNVFHCRFKHMETFKIKFDGIHEQIIDILSEQEDGDVAPHNEIYLKFENDFYHIQAIHKQLFEDSKDVTLNRSDSNIAATPKQAFVRLPKINLITFDGCPKDWQTFIDMYDSLIHHNESLSYIEKYNYLISTLRNEPLLLIKCTPLTSDNYMVAYNALRKRYDNTRLIATFHWHAIEQTKKISFSNNAKALRLLMDTFTENVSVLKNLKFPIKQWDFILFNLLFDRLDSSTATRFELDHGSELTDGQYYKALTDFLDRQCLALETVGNSTAPTNSETFKNKTSNFKSKNSSSLIINSKHSCQVCRKDHLIYNCPTFLSKTPKDRYSLAKQNKWCSNCLGSKHLSSNCTSQSVCRECSRKHHTLLHFATGVSKPNSSSEIANITPPQSVAVNDGSGLSLSAPSTSVNMLSDVKGTVLLSTAVMDVLDSSGRYQKVRIVLDCASQCSFITSKVCSRLGLKGYPLSLNVRGIGQLSSHASRGVSCSFKPIGDDDQVFTSEFIILPQIASNMPNVTIPIDKFSSYSGLKLADPEFNVSAPVEMLLGAELFPLILKDKRIVGSSNEPIAMDTIFGWVLMGKINFSSPLKTHSLLTSLESSLDGLVKRFWELEQVPASISVSPDDVIAEELYTSSLSRNESGRYIVSLPFHNSEPVFKDSRNIALKRFLSLERRLLKNPALYAQYRDFMENYLSSGHMALIKDVTPSTQFYYIPHHCVVKPDSTTTKLRVVFDASTKDSQGLSLNDTLLTGPKLQRDIISILLRFRLHKVAFSCDIKQMFRQILVTDSSSNYQRILFRFCNSEPVQDYALATVTYGVNCSPFLANRTIVQVADDYQTLYPVASNVLRTDMFVDDVVSGADSLEDALLLQKQLIELLRKGCFELHKWISNSPTFLSHLSTHFDPQCLHLDLDTNYTAKILGLKWNPTSDTFTYQVTSLNSLCTKRTILSQLARIFDPIGFLTPVVLYLKVLMQALWSQGVDWDAEPPQTIVEAWHKFESDANALSKLQIPRRIFNDNILTIDLHGFADASELGYASVAYLRITSSNDVIHTSFIMAKARVAPLKRISVARLELCAALLLSNLLHYVIETYSPKLCFNTVTAWTDSSIVLSWIKSSPHKWTTFVSNRVTQIQEKIAPSLWNHVASEDNPADPASRGLLPSDLLDNTLWWAGPPFLSLKEDLWPRSHLNNPDFQFNTQEEQKKSVYTVTIEDDLLTSLINRFSSLSKILHTVCYILRFIRNSRNRDNPMSGHFSINELDTALWILIKHVQSLSFSREISLLMKNKTLPKPFRKLTPFLDNKGILRVGGRLVHSHLTFQHKHPALLPSSNRLTHLIIEYTHKLYLHPGLQTLQFLLAQRYWILSPKRTIRKVVSFCHKCFRANPISSQPPMGNLPRYRISQVKPFSRVGIDYGGPFLLTQGRIRGAKTFKGYICLFVCMATKAIHLEVASDLSSDTFLAALRRFISRRGRCDHIYSDCGTNFVGAYKQLKSYMKSAAIQEGIDWHFIPPLSPNFGGLWEAGIKSVKSHLSRVVGQQILTFEEFYTLLVQVEAVLNSRPLCPLSNDPNDLSVLTPGHFLTLEPLNSLPEPNLCDVKLGRLSRWQLIQRFQQEFWSRWHREYLHTLIQRSKWTEPSTTIKPDSLVLLKDELQPPLNWQVGRVVSIHPGSDGVTRVVTVKTAKGTFKRPVTKVCPLPVSD